MARPCLTRLLPQQKYLIESHIDLPQKVKLRLLKSGKLPRHLSDEADGWAFLGLISAGRTWVDGLGSNFKTWAQIKIVGAIRDGMRAWDWAPPHIRRADNRSMAQGCQTSVVRQIEFSALLRDRHDKGRFMDRMPGASMQADIQAIDDEDELAVALSRLPERSRRILRWRASGVTCREIGRWLGVSEPRVYQIEKAAMEMVTMIARNRAS